MRFLYVETTICIIVSVLSQLLYFDLNVKGICLQGYNQQSASTGSDNGLAPNRWQVIIWTDYGLVYWPIQASPGLKELYGNKPLCEPMLAAHLYDSHTTKFNWNMMTSSNGNIFRVTGHLCGEFPGPRWIPRTKASDAELWSFFDLRLIKRLSKQSWGWWFETLLCPLWRHCKD